MTFGSIMSGLFPSLGRGLTESLHRHPEGGYVTVSENVVLGLGSREPRPKIHDVETLGVVFIEIKEMTVFLEDNFWSKVVIGVQALIWNQDRR